MSKHLIVGAGPVGSAVARLLAAEGEDVIVVTRGGGGPEHPQVERVAADAGDADRLTGLARDAVVVYNCANPKYTRWATDWPPLAAAMIAAARRVDAVLATTGNLYAYGPVAGAMTEQTPLATTRRNGGVRRQMWQDALASGVRTVEARGSDYLGVGANSLFSAVVLPAVGKGRTAWVPADVDAPHTFTYIGDMARTLVSLARDERSWGQAWHVPSPPAISIRDLTARYAAVSGRPAISVRSLPRWMMRTAGTVVPMARALAEVDYQFYAPFVADTSAATRTFGLQATDLDTVLREVHAAGQG